MNILIVDDSAPMRRAIRTFVDDLVDDFHECSDGDEALSAYATWQPDWVFMDIEMKNVDGIQATQQIVAAYPTAQIVIITNYDHAELRAAAQRAGACGFIAKDNLLDVRRLLGDK